MYCIFSLPFSPLNPPSPHNPHSVVHVYDKRNFRVYIILCLSSFTQIMKWKIHYGVSAAVRKKHQWNSIQGIWNYPVWGLEGGKRMKKNEQNLRDLKYRIKNKIYIVQVPRTEWDWEMGGKIFEEIMTENF